VGFAAAAQQGEQTRLRRLTHAAALAEEFLKALSQRVPRAQVHGSAEHRVPWILSVSVRGLSSEALLRALEEHGVCVSAGAACHARSPKQSHVLEAIGADPRRGTMRVSFGPDSTVGDAQRAVVALARSLQSYALP
jgi:cysteine desulfurase